MNALKRGDYKAAVGFLQQDAAAPSLDAMVALGGIYLDEISPLYDRLRGAEWLTMAAAQESAQAQFLLGVLLYDGVECDADPAAAAHWFGLAASKGIPEGAYNLAVLYNEGTGVPRDAKKAVALYRQAADNGVVEAAHTLGSMLAFGRDVRRNVVEGGMWLVIASEAGDRDVADELRALRRKLKPAEIKAIKIRADPYLRNVILERRRRCALGHVVFTLPARIAVVAYLSVAFEIVRFS
jgi:TPR repeat protein